MESKPYTCVEPAYTNYLFYMRISEKVYLIQGYYVLEHTLQKLFLNNKFCQHRVEWRLQSIMK